jgi:hypothetical protein
LLPGIGGFPDAGEPVLEMPNSTLPQAIDSVIVARKNDTSKSDRERRIS